jgi:hypothetical protein
MMPKAILEAGLLRINNNMTELTPEQVEALQQEVEQLRTQVARMREVLAEVEWILPSERHAGYCPICQGPSTRGHFKGCKLKEALSNTVQDYHNPDDVLALEKAREAIQRAKENFEPYGEYEYDVRYDLEEALAEIDKALGGNADV